MWSDNDIDNAFQRLNPPEPEPTAFPLDAWLRLESQLDKAVIERAVRRRLWQFFAAEVAVVALVALGWLLFRPTTMAPTTAAAPIAGPAAAVSATTTLAARHLAKATKAAHPMSSIAANTSPVAAPNTALASVPAAAARVPQASSTASPIPSANAAAPLALAISRPAGAHPLVVAPATALVGHRRTILVNVEESARQRSFASGFVAASGARKTALRSRERRARAGRYAVTSASNEAAAGDASAVGTPPTSRAPGLSSSASYAVAAEAHRPANAHFLNNRTADATEATNAAAGSASTRPGADANTAADGIAPLALRPVLAPLAGSGPLPMPLATLVLAEIPLQPEVPKPVREPRFYVALLGAPDVSTVKFAGIEKPMANVGLLLEYRLTSRLRVNTGLLRANKRYVARREDYDFGANSARVYQRDFTAVDGSCTVLDVPLNLRYDLMARPRYRVFGNAGLSSFLMQREDYSYEYPNPATGLPNYWTGSATNLNRHYFSILNLSAGYERSLNGHWSLQAEPYLKLPLAGVGNGKLRLTSAGVFFGVKYGL